MDGGVMYLRGPVLSPGLVGRPDLGMVDRPLVKWEIRKAASEFLEGSRIDVQHNFKGHATVVESHVTETETFFKGKSYPAGTWFITAKVSDPEIQEAIIKGFLTGFSVGAYPEQQLKDSLREVAKKFLCKGMFCDVGEGEWFALAVSIVDIPFYPEMIFEALSEEEYIKKSLKQNFEVGQLSEKEDSNLYGLIRDMFQTIAKKDNNKEENSDLNQLKEEQEDIRKKLEELGIILKDMEEKLETSRSEEDKEDEVGSKRQSVRKAVISHAKSLIEDGEVDKGEWDDSTATLEDYKELAAVIDSAKDPETESAYSYLLGKQGKIYSKAVSSALSYAKGARGAPKFPELVNALNPLAELLKEEGKEEEEDEGISKSLPLDNSTPEEESLYEYLGRDALGRNIHAERGEL